MLARSAPLALAAIASALLGLGCAEPDAQLELPAVPLDRIPAPGEAHNTIESDSLGWSAHNETDDDDVQWLVLRSSETEMRVQTSAYPVSFFPSAPYLLVVAADSGAISGLEVLDLDDPTAPRRRLTNIGMLEGPGPLPRSFVPPPIDSGNWTSSTTFQWYVPGDGTFAIDLISGAVSRVER